MIQTVPETCGAVIFNFVARHGTAVSCEPTSHFACGTPGDALTFCGNSSATRTILTETLCRC
jgi:hypothetical protein